MREYLFRGKTKDGRWVYGFVLNAEHTLIGYYKNGHDFCIIEVIPETVGEYTGLCDKNGNKIFEGDIVYVEYGEVNGVVFFDEYSRFVVTTIIGDYQLGHIDANCEVIGNITDNKNLLED